MRSTKSISSISFQSGQVSLEALILWAGAAAVLSLLIPVFTGLVHAQSVRVDVENVRSFSHSVSSTLSSFAFLSSGSQQTLSIPLEKDLAIAVEEDFIEFTYFSEGMNEPYAVRITSALPLTFTPGSEGDSSLVIRRVPTGIMIQFAEPFLP